MTPLPGNLSAVGPIDYPKIVPNGSLKQRININPCFEERSKASHSLQLLDEEVRSNGMSSGVLEAFQDSWKRMLSWNPTFHVLFRWNVKSYRVGLQKAWMLIDLEIAFSPVFHVRLIELWKSLTRSSTKSVLSPSSKFFRQCSRVTASVNVI